jgi:hypothetical protein
MVGALVRGGRAERAAPTCGLVVVVISHFEQGLAVLDTHSTTPGDWLIEHEPLSAEQEQLYVPVVPFARSATLAPFTVT